jgi:hypothetical protein
MHGDTDVILVDESHNFRNKTAQRYENLERIVALNGGKGRNSGRKKIILLTATPINNDLFDLYNQINFVTQGDRSYFSSAGIFRCSIFSKKWSFAGRGPSFAKPIPKQRSRARRLLFRRASSKP